VVIALWNSGGIRASIDERINGGNITLEDVLAVAPFGNTMDVVALKGKHLKEVLERAVRDYDPHAIDPPGSLLQVSGLRLVYNISLPAGSRLVKADARCADCRVPKFLPIEDEKEYEVVMNTYMAKGGDGFDVIAKHAIRNRNTDELDIDIITTYAAKTAPVTIGLEDRIVIIANTEDHHDVNSTEPVHKKVADRVQSGLSSIGKELNKAGEGLMMFGRNQPVDDHSDATTEHHGEDHHDATTEHHDEDHTDTTTEHYDTTTKHHDTTTEHHDDHTVTITEHHVETTKAPNKGVLDRVQTGLDSVGKQLGKVGEDIRKIPSNLPKIPIFPGRRRR